MRVVAGRQHHTAYAFGTPHCCCLRFRLPRFVSGRLALVLSRPRLHSLLACRFSRPARLLTCTHLGPFAFSLSLWRSRASSGLSRSPWTAGVRTYEYAKPYDNGYLTLRERPREEHGGQDATILLLTNIAPMSARRYGHITHHILLMFFRRLEKVSLHCNGKTKS